MDIESDSDSYTRIYRLVMAAWGSQAIRCLASLSIAEHLEKAALSAQQIAERESVDPAMLFRLLRAGAAMGLVRYHVTTDTFSTTPALRVLHQDASKSLKHYVQAAMGQAFWLPGFRLPQAVAQGRTQTADALGQDLWEHYASHPDERRIFTEAMTELSTPVIREAVSVIDPGSAKYALDIGGANGIFVSELVEQNPQLTGAVFDLAHVIPGAVEEAKRRGLGQQVSGIAGDFFESVPSADMYLLKFILHDWDDQRCVTLLTNIRSAMNPGAKLFIVEMLLENDSATIDAALMDLVMLFGLGGKERGMSEFEDLFEQAGMRVSSVKPLHGGYHVIETVAK
ncbi:methyltransferase [Mycobacterium montefiorense]|uniref:methyltransferase n=1 Tax=Mycobacterium montefiorense TaxID=154654 RepID=UPI0021DBC713|nr:methyltransferase [Mycobacterium montefiorense]MCV7426966.1 methyltransferase [Mycobacterium montefiorense]GLE52203.1 O-methyltransferase [Mycobacterium montefiorense]